MDVMAKNKLELNVVLMTAIATVVWTLTIAGCAMYQDPQVPTMQQLNVPASFKQEHKLTGMTLDHFSSSTPATPSIHAAPSAVTVADASSPSLYATSGWWHRFHDEQLDQLVILAVKNNLNLKAALKNIQIASTYVTENAASLLPGININYGVARSAASNNAASSSSSAASSGAGVGTGASTTAGVGAINNLQQLSGSVSYEVDAWNRIRNSVKQTEANVNASKADSGVVKLTLVSNVIDIYFQIVALNANLQNLKQQYYVTKEVTQINQDQYKSGLINIDAFDSAKIQEKNAQININNLTKQRQILCNTLAYLVGTYPESFTAAIDGADRNGAMDGGLEMNRTALVTSFSKMIPARMSVQMIQNRPDIQKAFYAVMSYGYAEKQSLANFLPTFALTGSYGFASSSLTNFVSGGSVLWNFGASILQPLLDWGKRTSQRQRAKLQYETAVLSYRDVVINACKEIANALVSYQQDASAFKSGQIALNAAQEKLNAARAQYQAGVMGYATYLGYKLSFLQNKSSVINQHQAVVADVIQVYKTLGVSE